MAWKTLNRTPTSLVSTDGVVTLAFPRVLKANEAEDDDDYCVEDEDDDSDDM